MSFRTPQAQPNELPPSGMAIGRCYRLIDLGTQASDFYKNSKRKVIISFELPMILHKGGSFDAQPFQLHKQYTLSHSESSNLRSDLESWYGRTFSTEDLNKNGGFDLEKLIDRYALLNIVHSEDRKYANIKSVNPLAAGMERPRAYNQNVVFTLEDFDEKIFNDLSDNLKNKIMRSQEYAELKNPTTVSGRDFPEDAGDLDSLSFEGAEHSVKPLDDDDIPF